MWNYADSSSKRTSVFNPSGQIGLVCDGKSLCLSTIGSASFITVSNSRQFAVYDCLSLRLAFISLPLISDIRLLTTKFENTYVVLSNNSMYSFYKYEQRSISTRHSHDIIGIFENDERLVTYSCSEIITYYKEKSKDDNAAASWTLEKLLTFDNITNIVTVLPLSSFANKVLIGCLNGRTYLCNIRSGSILHTFESKVPMSVGESRDELFEAVAVIAQSQNRSLGIVAIGYKSGYVAIVDVKTDEVLGGFHLTKKQKEPCSMLFTYDKMGLLSQSKTSPDAKEVLIVGAYNGDIVVFDLTEFIVFYSLESVHNGPIKHLLYIEKMKQVVTSGSDNSIIVWAMDSDKTFLRELKARRGILGNINIIEPYDTDELDMLVCSCSNGVGYLGKISTIQQHQCVKFSQKGAKNKIKKITGIASSHQRHYDWPNIITCHLNTHQVYVWSGHRKALVDTALKTPESKATATAVCVTKCGNYAIVGYENGEMHSFTLQSCNHDKELVYKDGRNELVSAHNSKIIDISLVGDTKIQSVCNSKTDRTIRMWNILDMSVDSHYDPLLPDGSYVYLAKTGHLLTALGCSDGNIYICDVIGKQIIRTLSYSIEITSMAFHPNGSWFIASASDATMVVYDILAACYVDYVKFSGTVIDANIDSSGTFLNVSNEDGPGMIMRYSNRHAFQLYTKTILYKELPKEPILLKVPVFTEEIPALPIDEDMEVQVDYTSKKTQLDTGLITLSGLSSSKLHNILYLDKIKEKSKPIEPPKINDDIPFFIPTTYKDGQLVFLPPEEEKDVPTKTIEAPKKIQTQLEDIIKSKLANDTKYEKMMDYLLSQTSSGIHISLGLFGIDNKEESLLTMLKFFEYHVAKKTNYDAVQAFLYIFLKIHGEELGNLRGNEALKTMEVISSQLNMDGKMLQEKFDRISCFIKFFTHLQME